MRGPARSRHCSSTAHRARAAIQAHILAAQVVGTGLDGAATDVPYVQSSIVRDEHRGIAPRGRGDHLRGLAGGIGGATRDFDPALEVEAAELEALFGYVEHEQALRLQHEHALCGAGVISWGRCRSLYVSRHRLYSPAALQASPVILPARNHVQFLGDCCE